MVHHLRNACSLLFLLCLAPTALLAQTTYFPARGLFNGFLEQVNIVECDNGNSTAISPVLRLRNSAGQELATLAFSIEGFGTRHIILNDLANIRDSYGMYSLELATEQILLGDRLSCRTAVYRNSQYPAVKSFDYALALPVQNPQLGPLSGIYNSMDPSATITPTYNWLSIVNYDQASFSADVDVFATDGQLVEQLPVRNLPPGGRVDLPLGHNRGQTTGLYTIRPLSATQSYEALLVRYNPSSRGGFNFAFPLRAIPGNCTGEPLLASTMGNGLTHNWLEIGNANSLAIEVTIEVNDRAGNLLHQERRSIPALGQSHMYLSSIIDPSLRGNVGSARVVCDDTSDKLIIQSSYYGFVPNSVGARSLVEWAYSTQAKGNTPASSNTSLSAPINTFLGMANWLKLADAAALSSQVNFNTYNMLGQLTASGNQSLAVNGTIDLGLHEFAGPNAVGSVITNTPTQGAAYRGEVLRVLPRSDQQIGTIMNIAGVVQQPGIPGGSNTGFRGDPQSLAPYRDNLTHEEAQLLLSRAAFGGNLSEVARVQGEGLRLSVQRFSSLVDSTSVDEAAIPWLDGDANDMPQDPVNWQGVRRWWIYHMRYNPNALRERLSLVLHDLFATSCRVVDNSDAEREHCLAHVQLLRSEAFGNFRRLLKSITTDYTMLVWLNNNLNQKSEPDENYAREHWELFTTGETVKEGGRYPRYTDADIAEAARAFTGWTTVNINGEPSAVYVPARHDDGTKTLWRGTPYEVSGNFDYNSISDVTLDHRPEAAQFVARRLFNAFVHDHPSPALINQLANLIKQSNWEILPVIRTILMSEAMFSADSRFSRIKDPTLYVIGFLKQTNLQMRIDRLETAIGGMGMRITDPPDVNGWPGNKHKEAAQTDYFLAWAPQYANSITEIFRNLNDFLDAGTGQNPNNLALLLPNPAARSAAVVDHFAKMLDVTLSSEERQTLISYMDTFIDSSGNTRTRIFDPAVSTHLREKVPGVLWILSQHENYVTL